MTTSTGANRHHPMPSAVGGEADVAGTTRRRQDRSSVIVPGWLLVLDGEKGTPEICRVSTRDVSEGGAKVVSPVPLPTNQTWYLRFSGLGGETKFIESEVRHIDEQIVPTLDRRELRRYFYGVRFVRLFDVSSVSDEVLRENVQLLLQETKAKG